jgi:hypothetical protein
MTDAERLAGRIGASLPQIESGTLRFWGEWFGRPYDNWHRLVRCNAEGDLLRLHFDQDELLCVWAPRRAVVDKRTFRIADAARLRWEWFYYGRPKISANRYFMDFTMTAASVNAETNVDWYAPDLRPTRDQPAVELHFVAST